MPNPFALKERPGEEAPREVFGWRPYALAFSASWVSHVSCSSFECYPKCYLRPQLILLYVVADDLFGPQHRPLPCTATTPPSLAELSTFRPSRKLLGSRQPPRLPRQTYRPTSCRPSRVVPSSAVPWASSW